MPIDFRSDNTLGASPEILEALARESAGAVSPYGFDAVTVRLRERCRELFECDLEIFPVATGTAANALAIASMTPPWGAVFCHAEAHVYRDELGAPEHFSGGAKLIPIRGVDGKLTPSALAASIDDAAAEKRMGIPSCVSLAQATEAGTTYMPDEVRALSDIAKSRGLGVHIDGARFANALAAARCTPAELTWRAGVDVLNVGATKNGALAAELLVVFRPELAAQLVPRLHRSGHRFSKMRFLSAQLDAYLADDLWLRNARHANECAARIAAGIADVPGVEILRTVQANIVFVRLAPEISAALQAREILMYDWPLFGADAWRIVCGFSTRSEDVDALIDAIHTR